MHKNFGKKYAINWKFAVIADFLFFYSDIKIKYMSYVPEKICERAAFAAPEFSGGGLQAVNPAAAVVL